MASNTYLGTFPNDARTAELVLELRAKVRDVAYIWQRGRGPRKNPALAAGRGPRGFDQSMPLPYSSHVALYFRPKAHATAAQDELMRRKWADAWRQEMGA